MTVSIASALNALKVVAGCAGLGVRVFGGYTLAFSTAAARKMYTACHRWLEGLLAAVFGYAGLKQLASSAN